MSQSGDSVPAQDPAGAGERTALAWQRTSIASFAAALLALRAGLVDGLLGVAIAVTVLLMVAALAEWRFGARVYGERRRRKAPQANSRALLMVAATTLVAAVASIVLAVHA